MNSLVTILPPPAAAFSRTPILNKNGFSCSLLTLAPGAEIFVSETPEAEEQILFVVEGEAAIRLGNDVTTMLAKDSALLVPGGRQPEIAANSGSWTKLLRVRVPARRMAEPEIVTLSS